MRRIAPPALLLLLALIAAGCLSASPPLHRYVELVRKQDSAEIARMFGIEGQIEHVGQPPIVGRVAIRSFLDSFSAYKVLSHEMTAQCMVRVGDCVRQQGTYSQRVRTPQGEEVAVHGWFRIDWKRQPDHTWLIAGAETSSSPLPPPSAEESTRCSNQEKR